MEKNIGIRDKRDGGWFWADKIIFAVKGLTSSEKLVYLVLAMYANNNTQKCYPSLLTLCKATGLTKQTIVNSLKSLEKRKVVSVHRTKGKSNIYTLKDLSTVKLVKNKTWSKISTDWSKIKPGVVQNKTTNKTNITRLINNKACKSSKNNKIPYPSLKEIADTAI